jgi:hypothetical protein
MKVLPHHATLLTVLLAMALMSPAAVFAQAGGADEDLSEADLGTLIQLAREAFEAQDYDTAIRRLLLANRMEPNPRLLLNVARSYAQKGDCVRSLVYYEAYTRHPDAEDNLLETARRELARGAECEGYSDKLAGRLVLESEPLGADVIVAGQSVGKTPRELVGYPAGSLTIRFELEGYAPSEQTVVLEPRTDQAVAVVMERPSAQAPGDATLTAASPAASTGSSVNWAAIGLMGAGVAGLTVGAVYDLVLIPQTDEERRLLTRPEQDDEFARLTDQRKTQATIAIAGYVTGGVLLAGGAAWFIYDMVSAESDSDEKAVQDRLGWRVAPMVAPQGGGVWLMRRF